MNRITYYLMVACIMTGCSEKQYEILNDAPLAGEPIGISAGIVKAEVTTRADGYTLNTPTIDNPLDADVWFSTTSANSGSATSLPRHSRVLFRNGTLNFPYSDVLPYPNGNVYAVGLYPSADSSDPDWSADDDNQSASHDINGQQDLMVAPQVSASGTVHFTSTIIDHVLQFRHLLSWVRIRVCSADNGAPVSWGKVKKIEIQTDSKLTVNLTTGEATFSTDKATNWITVYNNATGYTLGSNAYELCSVFCSPETSYQLRITTDNVSNVVNEVTLTPLEAFDSYEGKVWVMTLYFDTRKLINAVCTLNPWDEDSETLYGNVS